MPRPIRFPPGRCQPLRPAPSLTGPDPIRAKEEPVSPESTSDNVTPLPRPNWTRKINIPLPVLPLHIRQRLRTPGFWTAALAMSAFGAVYASGRLPDARDIVVALALTGFVVFLSAVGMVCQAIKDTHATAAGRQVAVGETAPPRHIAA